MIGKCRAREIDPSYHVEYAIDENESQEVENLTHVDSVDDEDLAERSLDSVAWICDLGNPDSDFVQLLVSINEEGWTLRNLITAETAEQLSDMFAQVAAASRIRTQARAARLEAELKAAEAEAERIKGLQGNLF